ncbi:hypothetical protein CCACVL1_22072 [Corchorus capsularis]|uniref:Uncharacterized protein n=1 Tax=Corchorus capsularis TaxID=210143 RepID=A0A1R3H173_COCAP|nr:hypothetical protein CCACVL1_22072 [Corchorus capsularis]
MVWTSVWELDSDLDSVTEDAYSNDSMLHDVVDLPNRKLTIGKEMVMKLPAAA